MWLLNPSHYERGRPRAQLWQHSRGSQTQQFAQQLANSGTHHRGPATLLRTENTCSAVVLSHRTQAPATTGATVPVTPQVPTQTAERCVWAALGPLTEAAGTRLLACKRCVLVDSVCYQVKEMQEEVSTLHSMARKGLTIFSETLKLHESEHPTRLKEERVVCLLLWIQHRAAKMTKELEHLRRGWGRWGWLGSRRKGWGCA